MSDDKTEGFLARESKAGVVVAGDDKIRALAKEQYDDGYYFGHHDGYAAGKAAAEADRDALTRKIAAAPHAGGCSWYWTAAGLSCTCWKADTGDAAHQGRE